jgi:pilus assembly protein CpaE
MMELLSNATTLEPVSRLVPSGRPAALAFVNDPESEAVLKTAFREETPGAVLRGDITKAIQYLSETRSPRVLVVDISNISLPVSEVHRLADVCEPGVSVVVIGNRDEVGLYRDLLQAGVAEYIVKPLTDTLVAKALHTAGGGAEPTPISRKLGKVIAFVGGRGGVGTSTMAVNLAWYFSTKQARRVALVDLDLHTGVCSLMLNVPPSSGLREALENPLRVDSLFLERTLAASGERLYVLGSEEPLEADLQFSGEAIDRLLEVLREQFHYVIMDVPHVPSSISRRVLDLADTRVVVLDPTLQSIRDAARLCRIEAVNGSAARPIVIVHRAGETGRRSIKADDIAGALQQRVRSVVPYQPTLFADAAAQGGVAAAKRGRFADAIAALATEISGQAPPQRSRWSLFR